MSELQLRALLSSPSLPSSFGRFFSHLPHLPQKGLGLLYTTGLMHDNPNTIKSYKISQKLSPKYAARVLRTFPTNPAKVLGLKEKVHLFMKQLYPST